MLNFANLTRALLLTILALTPPTLTQQTPTTACAKGIHIIAAAGHRTKIRGGYGSLINLVDTLKDAIPHSTSFSVPYPKFLRLPQYPVAVAKGQENMMKAIGNYVESCPRTKIVLLGYSEVCMFCVRVGRSW